MLVNLAEILAPAVEGGYGVACFNVFGWEDAEAVVQAAAQIGSPLILSANPDLVRFMPVEIVAHMFRALGEQAPVPVCAHLDHTYEIDAVLRGVDVGFTSVMFDGSQLPLEANIAGSRTVARYAHAAGCSVEAEIGSVPYAEGRDHIRAERTVAAEAARLATESGVDALAVSVGNVHRLGAATARIDFDQLSAIESAVRLPLVIHGASGIPEADLRRLAGTRVSKFNIGTRLRQAFGQGLRETLSTYPSCVDRIEIMRNVQPYVTREAVRMLRILGWRE